MKYLAQFGFHFLSKNGKQSFRFLRKENNDDAEGRQALLETLIRSLTPEERNDLIIRIADENRDLVKAVLEKVGNKTTPENRRERKSSFQSKENAQKETVKKIENVLAKEVRDESEEVRDKNVGNEDFRSDPEKNDKMVEPLQATALPETTTDHNLDRAHQDLDKSTYETTETTPLDHKKEAVANDIKKFREDIDLYVKQALPEKGLALTLGVDEINRRYAIDKHVLDQVQVFAEPIWDDLRPRIQNYESKITNFSAEYRSLQTETDPNEQFMKRKALVESFQKHIQAWHDLQEKIRHAKDQMTEVFQKVMGMVRGEMFARDYFQGFDGYVDSLSKTLEEFDDLASQQDYNFDGDEIFWTTIPKRIQVLRRYLNPEGGGKIDQISVDTTDLFKKQINGIKFLHRNNFFEADGDEKFQKNFQASVSEVRTFRSKYQRKFSSVKSILDKEINQLTDEEFIDKYSLTKEQIYDYLASQETQLERFSHAANEYGRRRFLGQWIQNYNHPDTRVEALQQMTAWAEFDTAVTNAKDPLKPEYRIIGELDTFLENYHRPVTSTHIFFSLYDAQQMFKEYFDYRKRLWTRRSDRAVSKLGVQAFGSGDPRTQSQIAKEFIKKDEESEDARVGEYKTQKGSYNTWDIRDDLYNTSNSDEAKACIDMLIDRGGLEWFDPQFWNTLNRLEGFSRFKPSDTQLDRGALNRKLRDSISNIWSEDYFNTWTTKIEGSRKSAMDNYAGEYDSYETDNSPVNPRTRIMTDMIYKAYNGITEGVDPARFEGFLRASVPAGKQNGGPRYDQRVWFLIHGVASGVLGPEALARMNGAFLYDLPIVDFFTDKAAWKKDGRIVPAGTPGAEARPWKYSDYLKWGEMLGSNGGTYAPVNGYNSKLSKFVYNNIMNANSVRDRTQRGVRNAKSKWDHDDGAMYTPVLTASDVGQMLTAESKGTEQMTSDFWRNFLSEYKYTFHATLEQINEGDQTYGLDNPGWQEFRKTLLRQVGDRIKAALTVTLTLQGNLGYTDGRPTTPFSKDKWQKNTSYSPSAEASKETIDTMAKIFFKNANLSDTDRQKYETLIDYRAIDEGDNYKTAKFKTGNQEFRTQTESLKLVAGEVGNQIFSSDLDVIERSLREFCEQNPVGPGE